MCTSHTPKVEQPTQKPPVYMSNPYLDGLGIGTNTGRNSLRIDMGSSVPTASSVSSYTPSPSVAGSYGNLTIGNYGGGAGVGGRGNALGIGSPRVFVR